MLLFVTLKEFGELRPSNPGSTQKTRGVADTRMWEVVEKGSKRFPLPPKKIYKIGSRF